MKTLLLGMTMTLVLILGLGTGCVFSIGGEGPHEHHGESKSSPPTVVMASNTEDAAVLAEIDAAGKLDFEDSRVNALKQVAGRSGLTPANQVHLVNVTLRKLSFDQGRVDVLLTLIQNPAFSPAAKEAIFRQMERLDF